MAGPTVGPILDRLGLELIPTFWKPDGNFPGHEPNPLLPENRELVIAAGARQRRRPRHRLRRRRRPLASSSTRPASSCPATSCTGPARPLAASHPPRLRDPLRPARDEPRCCRHRDGRRRARLPQPRRPRLLQDPPCARRDRCSAARSRATTTSATSTAPIRGTIPGTADARAVLTRGPPPVGAAGPLPRPLLHLREINSEVADQQGEAGADRGPLTPTRRQDTMDGISIDYDDWHFTCARPTPSRCFRLCLSRWSPTRTWSAAATRSWH